MFMLEDKMADILSFFLAYEFWLVLIVSFFVYRKMTVRQLNLPPLPHSWPIIGNMYHVFRQDQLLYKWCKDVSKEAGPVFRLSFGRTEAVIINDVDSAYKAMMDKSWDFAGRMKSKVFEIFTNGYSDVVFADADQPNFKPRRKLLATALRNFSVGRPYEKRVSETLDRLVQLFDGLATGEEAFDPKNYCQLVSYNVTANMCFQKGYAFDDPDFIAIRDVFEEMKDIFNHLLTITDIIPVTLPFELWDVKAARRLNNKLRTILGREIERSRQRGLETNEIGDLTLFVLKTRDEGIKEGMNEVTDNNIHLLLTNVFAAGVDTTQTTLRWLLLCLAMHPEVQEKVYQEIQDNLDDEASLIVSAIDYKNKMPYSEAVVLETTRYGTVLPWGLPHRTLCDTKIGEYDIPKGTLVLLNQWAINHDERNFEKPDEFMPERFLDSTGKLGPRPRGYMPFGLGRRSCPGESAARTTVWITYVSLVKRYRFLPPEGVQLKAVNRKHPFEGTPEPYDIVVQRRT